VLALEVLDNGQEERRVSDNASAENLNRGPHGARSLRNSSNENQGYPENSNYNDNQADAKQKAELYLSAVSGLAAVFGRRVL
jgi:hypothetical protein